MSKKQKKMSKSSTHRYVHNRNENIQAKSNAHTMFPHKTYTYNKSIIHNSQKTQQLKCPSIDKG